VKVEVKVSPKGKIAFLLPPAFSTAVCDLMLGGEGEAKENVDNDDLDAIKEIVSNILGALSTTLEAQKDMENFKFEILDIKYVTAKEDFSEYSYIVNFNCKVKEVISICGVLFDEAFLSNFHENTSVVSPKKEIHEEVKNLEMLMDIKLQLRVRIGSKVMRNFGIQITSIGSKAERLNTLKKGR